RRLQRQGCGQPRRRVAVGLVRPGFEGLDGAPAHRRPLGQRFLRQVAGEPVLLEGLAEGYPCVRAHLSIPAGPVALPSTLLAAPAAQSNAPSRSPMIAQGAATL